MNCNGNTLAEAHSFVNERADLERIHVCLEGRIVRKIETIAARIRQDKPANSSIQMGVSKANQVAETPRFVPFAVRAWPWAVRIDATAYSKAMRSRRTTPTRNNHDSIELGDFGFISLDPTIDHAELGIRPDPATHRVHENTLKGCSARPSVV
jgi:hypothetical protein